MGKPRKNAELTEKQKAEALARALKQIEDQFAQPGRRARADAHSTPPSGDEASMPRRKAALESARQHMEAWMRDPPWFSFYAPYRSVLHGGTPEFVDGKGQKLTFRSPSSARQLLYLAKAAADEYLGGNQLTDEEWRKALGDWKRIVGEMRADIANSAFEFRDPFGGRVSLNFEELGPFEVLSVAYQLLKKNWQPGHDEESRKDGEVGISVFHHLWCVACLSEIDSAVLSVMYEDAGDGIDAAIHATEALANARECVYLAATLVRREGEEPATPETLVVPLRKEFALAGAKAKLAKDPKQAAKREVRGWWIRWRASPTLYQSKSDFARVMLDKYPALTSQPVIEGWCRDWEKEVASHPDQAI